MNERVREAIEKIVEHYEDEATEDWLNRDDVSQYSDHPYNWIGLVKQWLEVT